VGAQPVLEQVKFGAAPTSYTKPAAPGFSVLKVFGEVNFGAAPTSDTKTARLPWLLKEC